MVAHTIATDAISFRPLSTGTSACGGRDWRHLYMFITQKKPSNMTNVHTINLNS